MQQTRIDYELTYYVNDINTENTQVLMEYGKREELKNVYTYGNERISAETLADTYNPITDDYETDYYLYDGRGSVTQVVSTDEIVAEYTYDPFGNVTTGAPQFDSFYGYNAEDTNPVTGLQYLRARYYDSDSGRFSVADTYLGDISEPLTLNRYSYTTNNPVMYVDPSGHFVLTALLVGAAVGAAVGATVGAVSSGIKSYKTQKSTGKVNGWTVANDVLIGGVIGGVVGAVGGIAGAAIGAAGVALAGTGLVATAITGAVGAAFGGIVSTLLKGVASNIIQKTNLYKSAIYTQQKTPKQILDEAVGNAFDVESMVNDVTLGAVLSIGTYGIQRIVQKLKAVRQHSCGDAPKVTSQNPVDDITPDVPKETGKSPVDDADAGVIQNISNSDVSVQHAVGNANQAQSVLDGIDPKYFNSDSRFGGGFYVGANGDTIVSELAEHGNVAKYAISYDMNLKGQKVLDLTNPQVALEWGYAQSVTSTKGCQGIGEIARSKGYNVIKFQSYRGEGINYVIYNNFDDILSTRNVVPTD